MNDIWTSDEKEIIDKGNEIILLNLGFKHYDYKSSKAVYPHTIIVENGPYGWTNGDISNVYNKIASIKGQVWYRTVEDANFHLDWNKLIPAISKLYKKHKFNHDILYAYIIDNNKKEAWKHLVNHLQNGNR